MNDAELRGMITANSGQIGGWYISDQNIFISSDDMRTAAFLTIGKSEEEGVVTYYPNLTFSKMGVGYNSRQDTQIGLGGFSIKHLTGMTTTTINAINADGSGSLGRGGISWDTSGNFQVTQSLVNSIFNVLSSGQTVVYDDDHLLTSNKVAIKDTGISFINQVDANMYKSSLGSNCIKVESDFRDG